MNSDSFTRPRPFRQPPAQAADAVSLTERGLEYPFKMALLNRYGLVKPNDTLIDQVKQFTDVWMADAQVPVSMEPLGPEEQAAMATGQFSTFKRTNNPLQHHPKTQQRGEGAVGGGSRRYESNRAPKYQHQQDDEKNDETFGSFDPNAKFSLDRTLERPPSDPALSRPSYDRPVMPLRDFKDPTPYQAVHNPSVARHLSDLEEEGGHDEEAALWSMPANASRPGTQAAMGVFDDQSRFGRAPASWSPRPIAPIGSIGSNRVIPPFVPPQFYPMPPYAVSPVATSPPVITPETRWFYRDPSGAVQGPFGNQKMLDWYTRQYFPESLPLRRETDLAFETLTQWKIKCGGQPPFALAVLQQKQPEPPKPDLAKEERQFFESLTTKRQPVDALSNQLAQTSLQQPAEKTGWATLPTAAVPQPIQPQAPKPVQEVSQPQVAKPAQPVATPQVAAQPVVAKPAPQPAPPSWGRPAVAVKSLAEIQKEEAEAAAKAAAEQRRQNGAAPANSFAALVKKAAAAEPIAVPTVSTARIVTASSNSPASNSDAPMIKSIVQQPNVSPVSPVATPTTTTTLMTGSELNKWTMDALKPLAPNFDCSTIALLLADCRTAEDAMAFLRDNVRSKRLNLPSFCRDYAARRWGVQLKDSTLNATFGSSSAQQAAGLSSGGDEQADEFVTVSRKSKK